MCTVANVWNLLSVGLHSWQGRCFHIHVQYVVLLDQLYDVRLLKIHFLQADGSASHPEVTFKMLFV